MLEYAIMAFLLALLAISVGVACYLYGQLRASARSNRMKQVFLQSIGSEIRTPLRAVSEMAKVVAKEDLYLSKNEKRAIAEQMTYNANLIGTLFDEVLVFTDSGAQGHQLTEESFSPNALCRRCLEANQHSLYRREAVRLTFSRTLSDEFFVKSDRHLVELILNKLILNSCRFTEQGEVTVGCDTGRFGSRLRLWVRDTGNGIPENRMGNLFSWFEAPDDMKDEAELDLSICHRIAGKLGGDLLIEHSDSDGTCVSLLLPLKSTT